ncbi:MAG: group III truncated hemoglobin [Breznakibacter sp.]|nr:group III truncated hemoglobin [Breznakibacter sp.]
MRDIETREDLEFLILEFYKKVRADELLGVFFNSTFTTEEAWNHHYPILIDFWEQNLFDKQIFQGNPTMAHHGVDKRFSFAIGKEHFDRWVELWIENIDTHFSGVKVELSKTKLSRLRVGMYEKVLKTRAQLGKQDLPSYSILGATNKDRKIK